MGKNTLKKLSLFFCILLLLAFGSNVCAAEAPYYADEEAGTFGRDPIEITPYNGIVPRAAADGNLIVVIDPGHGGIDGGASNGSANERDLNLKVAQYCKTYLEKYPNVTVYLTRSDNESKKLELTERADIGAQYGADIIISMHFNSGGGKGAEAYISCLEEYELKNFATAVVNNLGDLGLNKRGVKTRESSIKEYWYDGERLADYYGMIREPAEREIPGVIIEHCFIDSEAEFNAYASTDAKLKNLGEADAKAIATAFKLDETISESALGDKKAAALAELEQQYTSMDLTRYSNAMQSRIEAVYSDAKNRMENATGSGKIELTLNRAVKTLANYPFSTGENETNKTPFTDVKTNHWFYPAVSYCYENRLFFGTGETTFSPQTAITRGMFIAVLGRMAGVEEIKPCETKFSDVNPNQYYAPHIKWATDSGIVAGVSETSYQPETNIRREDLVRMVHNYCVVNEIDLPTVSEKTAADFKDNGDIDSWAKEAMDWSIAKGIINGNDIGKLTPRANATRAEVAQIMMKFHQSITKETK